MHPWFKYPDTDPTNDEAVNNITKLVPFLEGWDNERVIGRLNLPGSVSYAGVNFKVTAFVPIDDELRSQAQRILGPAIDRAYTSGNTEEGHALTKRLARINVMPYIEDLIEITDLAVSSRRSVPAVRRLGEVSPIRHAKGVRTVAGTMIMALLKRDPLLELYSTDIADRSDSSPFFVDRIPPFHITMVATNEFGHTISSGIFNVIIVDFATTISINDMYTELQYCVDTDTEALTDSGWKRYSEIQPGQSLLTLNPQTKDIEWQPAISIHVFPYNDAMVSWKNYRGVDILSTPNHRWLTTNPPELYSRKGFADAVFKFQETSEISGSGRLVITSGGSPKCFSDKQVWSDELVELVGWAITEGNFCYSTKKKPYAVSLSQSVKENPQHVERIRGLASFFREKGSKVTESTRFNGEMCYFYFGKGVGTKLIDMVPGRNLNPEFLRSLTEAQAHLLFDTIIAGDGCVQGKTTTFGQNPGANAEMFQMLCAMLGKRTCQKAFPKEGGFTRTTVYQGDAISTQHLPGIYIPYQGEVWCPRTENMTWLARRKGGTFWTGNTFKATHIMPFVHHDVSQKLKKIVDMIGTRSAEVGSSLRPNVKRLIKDQSEYYTALDPHLNNRPGPQRA